jgi:hypothetical protein
MNIEQCRWTEQKGWEPYQPGAMGEFAEIIFLFGSTRAIQNNNLLDSIRKSYSNAHLFSCSTAGEIYGTQVTDDSIVATAVGFDETHTVARHARITKGKTTYQIGRDLGDGLDKTNLAHLLVLSDGLNVNGSELVAGLTEGLPVHVTVTGGLAGDGDRFRETYVLEDGIAKRDAVSVIGLYGTKLKVGCGSVGGWDPFGPERLITRSSGNILYEFDGKSALELYKKYLGEYAKNLPASGLLFPLCLRPRNPGDPGVVRTILSVSEEEQSMTFAGDVPEGSYARLMMANFDRLIDGACNAAQNALITMSSGLPELAILISCVGRKLVLQQRVEEELEGVQNILGTQSILTGFYSYGEISPFSGRGKCELHNQTMTVTTLSEK